MALSSIHIGILLWRAKKLSNETIISNIKSRRLPEFQSYQSDIESLVKKVEYVSRILPFGVTCLHRCYVFQELALEQDYKCWLCIGVKRVHSQWKAHAWIEIMDAHAITKSFWNTRQHQLLARYPETI